MRLSPSTLKPIRAQGNVSPFHRDPFDEMCLALFGVDVNEQSAIVTGLFPWCCGLDCCKVVADGDDVGEPQSQESQK